MANNLNEKLKESRFKKEGNQTMKPSRLGER